MKIEIWPVHGPLNSKIVFEKFIKSLRASGEQVYENQHMQDGDVAVIWSVLWQGRMRKYKEIWDRYRNKNKPVIVIEVGGIKRNETWKIGINGVNREADFANQDADAIRWKKFNTNLLPWKQTGEDIIICGQHTNSHQWRNNPPMSTWFDQQITEIRKYTDRPIVIRPHPRNHVTLDIKKFKNVKVVSPQRDNKTYDDTDLTERLKSAWALVSHSSNPAITAVMHGIPVYVSESSLSYDVGNNSYKNINNPKMPERQQWLNDYAHTEYTLDEISAGKPLKHLTSKLN